ncbi:GroES-like protein [Astrocystis sublimbata]|nr:GroES-like protein [Astrocystis sublimbata]
MTTPSTSALPGSMKAQFLDAFNTAYALRTVPLPVMSSPYDVLVKVDAASYCHTDAVLAAGQMKPYPSNFPHVGCHEFAGTVVALPENPASDLKIGDRIGVPGRSFHPCGTCYECAAGPTPDCPDDDPPGYSVNCPHAINNGISGDGGFREYAIADSRQIAPIPDHLSAVDTATLMCAGVTIYNALKRCALQPRQRVGIVGCGGGLGHLGLQFASKMGLKVVGVDNADGPLQLARSLGTGARIVDARSENAHDVAIEVGNEDEKRERGDMGLDAVIILPESQKGFDYGVGLLRNHGRCVVVSFPESGFRIDTHDIVFRDISVVGSLVGSNTVLREVLRFAADHGVRALIKTYPLSKLNELVDDYHKGEGGKLVIDMSLPD